MKNRDSPLFILVAMITAIAALIVAKSILLPISLAILLSFLLTPVADRLERWRIPRIPTVLSIVLFTFAILGAIGWTVTEQLIDLSLQLPKHEEMLLHKIRDFKPESPTWQRVNDTISNLRAELSKRSSTEPPAPPDKPAGKNSKPKTTEREKAKAALETVAGANDTPHPPTDDDAVPVKVVEMPPSPLQQAQDWLGPL
ncbi:MAG TPA: AI-2E family transporter, partial [Lacipirellulaceae bacterium]|nr:AI-2E family transporter [Lacipirellulaceae bacterium]